MGVNRGPSFARYHSAIAAALEAATADKAKKEHVQAGELPKAEAWHMPADLGPEHRRDVA